jgi:uncharacterized protein (UPF0210 family)
MQKRLSGYFGREVGTTRLFTPTHPQPRKLSIEMLVLCLLSTIHAASGDDRTVVFEDVDPVIVRTITTGITLTNDQSKWSNIFAEAAANNQRVARGLQEAGFLVQTTRVSTNPFCEYVECSNRSALLADTGVINSIAKRHGIQALSIGPATSLNGIDAVPDLLSKYTPLMSASAPVPMDADGIPDREWARHIAKSVLALAHQTADGGRNFGFSAAFNVPPGTPFFPVGYHRGPTSFAIGTQSASVLLSAFSAANGTLAAAKANLRAALQSSMSKIEAVATASSRKSGVLYDGIDTSVTSGDPGAGSYPGAGASLAAAYESLGLGRFGQSGTLFISSMITAAVRSLKIKRIGYSGLMLPVAEDAGLAQRANESSFSIHDVLTYSAVCGMGVDTIPVPGGTPPEKIATLYLDVAALAFRLDKPLAARLLPIPNKEVGEFTAFTGDKYLVNTRIFPVP